MSIEPNLHEVSDALLANLDRLRALELEKRSLPVGSPRIVELAREIEELAVLVLGTSDTQVDLAKALAMGASVAMMGGVFAGVDKAPGEVFSSPVGADGRLAALSVSQGYRSDWSGLFAGLTIAMLPVLAAYVKNFAPQIQGSLICARPDSKLPVKGITSIENIAVLNVEGAGMIGVPG